MAKRRRPPGEPEPFAEAHEVLYSHPLFAPMMWRATVVRASETRGNPVGADGWCAIDARRTLWAHPTKKGTRGEWTHAIAHSLLHLGFGHHIPHEHPREWNAACCFYVERFLRTLKLGSAPEGLNLPDISAPSEEKLYQLFQERGIPPMFRASMNGSQSDLLLPEKDDEKGRKGWADILGIGLSAAVDRAVRVASGDANSMNIGRERDERSAAQRARAWFMTSYPLLGALATAFKLIEDTIICARMQISVAAVDAEAREVYVNPSAGLSEQEARFVLAHELLHVGLRHHARRQGRDPWLWNVACDYVINGWLVEMEIGAMPSFGLLHEPDWKDLSAESIYDRLAGDLRKLKRLCTLRGVGLGDMIERTNGWWTSVDGCELDAWFRRCLGTGLGAHEAQGRGFIPAGLIEEIRALDQPAIPWEVELAQWFDQFFAPIEPRRTYARPSRRQAATPDVPRPRVVIPEIPFDQRTFGVVLDTSGSMDRSILAKALGAIASYAASRDVPAVRVVFCDAAPYDQGYVSADDIAGRVRVRGRGGTILQPGIDLIEAAPDFPKKGPILVITDGACDRLHVHREHAFLLPNGARLPFGPRGPIFRIS